LSHLVGYENFLKSTEKNCLSAIKTCPLEGNVKYLINLQRALQ
jgi:hypothetical protein